MNQSSRTYNTVRNLLFSCGAFLFNNILSFINRTIFVCYLSPEYLGANGLFSNILSLLSLAEMGTGGAFISLLYKPLYEENIEIIKSIMKAFRKVYFFIGFLVGTVGIALIPFLNKLIPTNSLDNFYIIYLLFLSNSVIKYFFDDRISLIKADQKDYIVTLYSQIFIFVQYIFQILILVFTRNYILFLIIQTLCAVITYILLSQKAHKLYPYLKNIANPLSSEQKAEVKRKVTGGFCLQAGYTIATGTDSIVIAKYLGLSILGVYSNYLLIINVINNIISMIFNSLAASASNLVVASDSKDSYEFFKKLSFLSFFTIGFSSVCLLVLLNPFISIWIGTNYQLPFNIVVLVIIIFYIGWDGNRRPLVIYKNALGLYYNDRYATIIEAILNLLISIILVKNIGIAGVFFGTIISTLVTFFTSAYVVYKNIFKLSLWSYFKTQILYFFILVITSFIDIFLINLIPHNTLSGFIQISLLCCTVTFLMFTLIFHKTEEFIYFRKKIYSFLQNRISYFATTYQKRTIS